MSDRAQDTEAIRAALRHASETVDYCEGCKADAALDRLVARLGAVEREAAAQMAAKIEAQMTLKLVTEALDLPFAELGNGWREATPKILARIETIVDEADRAFRERDAALAAAAPGETEQTP